MKTFFCENCRPIHLVGRALLSQSEAYNYVLSFLITEIFQLKTKPPDENQQSITTKFVLVIHLVSCVNKLHHILLLVFWNSMTSRFLRYIALIMDGTIKARFGNALMLRYTELLILVD